MKYIDNTCTFHFVEIMQQLYFVAFIYLKFKIRCTVQLAKSQNPSKWRKMEYIIS